MKKNKKGFLLIDAVFSIVLISVLASYFLPVINNSIENRIINSKKSLLIDRVQYEMEEIIGQVYRGVKVGDLKKNEIGDEIKADFMYLGDNLYKVTVYSKEFKDEIKLYTILEEKGINTD